MKETFVLDLLEPDVDDDGPATTAGVLAVLVCVTTLSIAAALFAAQQPVGFAVPYLAIALVTLTTVWFLSIRHRVRILFGGDGLIVEGGSEAVSFLAFADLTHVSVGDAHVAIGCASRSPVTFRVRASWRKAESEAQRFALAVNEALAKWHIEAGDTSSAPVFAVVGETARERLASVRARGTSAKAPYRRSSIPRERLWRVVESSVARLDDRIAACIALRVEATAVEMTRLAAIERTHAGSKAWDPFRVALRGDDAQVERLLERETEARAASLPERLRRRRVS